MTPSLIEPIAGAGSAPELGSQESEQMNLQRRLVVLYVILALAGCAPMATGQGPAPDAPYPHDDKGNVHDRGFSM
jgi:hypothetical protein